MEKVPQFLMEFSKEENPEERKQAADEIRAIRKQGFEKSADAEGKHAEIVKLTEELEQLATQIENLSENIVSKVSNYLKIRALRAAQSVRQEDLDRLSKEQEEAVKLSKDAAFPDPDELPEYKQAREGLKRFYDDQQKLWDTLPYDKEDIKKYFSEENLASLSLEDYEKLLRRFPGGFVTHVTRQGVRDHNAMIEHSSGMGEFHDGFEGVMKDGRLRSNIGHFVSGELTEQAVDDFFASHMNRWGEEGLNPSANDLFGFYSKMVYAYHDYTAFHVAADVVANRFYGAETKNEIFFALPKMHIASQFNASRMDNTVRTTSSDVYIWAQDDNGINVNAGVVFIPKATMVDRETGSRYELDSNNKVVINSELFVKIKNLLEDPAFFEFAKQSKEILGHTNDYNRNGNEQVEALRLQLEKDFGIVDSQEQEVILDYNLLRGVVFKQEEIIKGRSADSFEDIELIIRSHLREENLLYKESQNTVTAQEYWENYFLKHPERRPSKIVYYKGDDPTKALSNWQDDFMSGRPPKEWDSFAKEEKYTEEHFGFSERQGQPAHIPVNQRRFASLLQASIERKFGIDLRKQIEEARWRAMAA